MDHSLVGEQLPLLQLQKWNQSHIQLNLSEFREAFISPTRQMLLLLSYQCEALLLPLLSGDIINTDDPDSDSSANGVSHNPGSLDLTVFNRSDLEVNLPSTSGSVQNSNNDLSHDSYPFISGVNSMAWGAYSDSYYHSENALFKDFLFISGSYGVTVHAFRQPESISENSELMPDLQSGDGRWMEWGPRLMSGQSNAGEASCLFYGSSEEPIQEDRIEGIGGTENGTYQNSGKSSFSSCAPKKWLRSFFTKVEFQESHGTTQVRFPTRSSFPHSAKVVSFNIFGNSFPSTDFIVHSHHIKGEEIEQMGTVLDVKEDSSVGPNMVSYSHQFKSAVLSKLLGVEVQCSYSCSKVFSSNSHNLIGFVATLVDSVPIGTTDRPDDIESTRCQTFVVVAQLDSWGLKYVSSVKLDEHVSRLKIVEWIDFCFSDDLLVCLTASGLLSFYAAVSGEYLIHLDIIRNYLFHPQLIAKKNGQMDVGAGVQVEQDDQSCDFLPRSSTSTSARRKFKRLLSACDTSLLAAVDEIGLTYVICAGEYLPEKCYPSMKLLPHFTHLEFGSLVGWVVGGFDIGHQLEHKWYSDEKLNHNGLYMSGFSTSKVNRRFQDLQSPLKCTRRVLFPIGGFSEDDCFCFSPLGIIRLTKKQNKDQHGYCIFQHNLRIDAKIRDDRCLNFKNGMIFKESEETFVGEAVGCSFQGCFYLVTQGGLSVVLPSFVASSELFPFKSVGHQQLNSSSGRGMGGLTKRKLPSSPWMIEVLDRCILYEGPEIADRLCLENGWDLKVSRLRWLQLSLDYLKFDEIELSLEMLVSVGLAEEGILKVLFRAAYFMFGKVGSDSEASAASRLLALASSFATKLIRLYGLLQQKRNDHNCRDQLLSLFPVSSVGVETETRTSKSLHEIAYLLEIIRSLQCRLVARAQRPGQGLDDAGEGSSLADMNMALDESELSIVPADSLPLKTSNHNEIALSVSTSSFGSRGIESLALKPLDYIESGGHLGSDDLTDASILVPQVSPALGEILRSNVLPLENPSEMVARWKMGNLDLKTVVKDALLSGRLPLAVLQLHLHRSSDLLNEEEHRDTFDEVRDVGRAIAYDLFLKGETRLAVATLQRLGEDIKSSLKQLMFGTTKRSLRLQIAEEMERCGFLGSSDRKMLERIALIERLYPSSSFWTTFMSRKEEFADKFRASFSHGKTCPLLLSTMQHNIIIECGEIDGIVLGSWKNVGSETSAAVFTDDAHGGYWIAAAIWCSMWDQKTVDRIILDQPFLMGVHVLWDSQLEYHICHNDWEEVARLLDMIPSASLSERSLQISLDGLQPSVVGSTRQISFHGDYPSPLEELDAVYMDVPDVKIFRFSNDFLCSVWLRTLLELELAKRFIFLREYWEGTSDIVPLLARSGLVTGNMQVSLGNGSGSSPDVKSSIDDGVCLSNSPHGLHKVIIRHCAQYGLPNLLDIYLDHHKLAMDNVSLPPLLEAVDECQWARWMLFSRIKGQEYEASFSNSRAIVTHHLMPNNVSSLETEEFVQTIDDIAEGGGELAALATLMYAPLPIQNCLSAGSVKRQSTSAQCTLENLQPTLQHFPTLWQTFVAACLGQDASYSFAVNKGINVFSCSGLSDYLNWRESIFHSADRDTSLMQMLPCWFPKAVRRLVQLYIEDPLGWQSMALSSGTEYLPHRGDDFFINNEEISHTSAINWEATIQRLIEEELYDSALKETGLGLEHHLHRGRALAAFNHLLGARVEKLKLERQSSASVNGQANVNADVQTLLAPLTQSEESVLASVMPLAVVHFDDPVLVASCSFLLELCGLSTSMLRIDVAALRRISTFYKSTEDNENYKELSPKGSAFHAKALGGDITESLARALADEYLHQGYPGIIKQKETSDLSLKRASHGLMLVLQHLEKASLPLLVHGKSCGSWLLNGNGDGTELRSQQKAASQHWNLVTIFCQMHHISLSTKYLASLARDNDWVGFLSEAQIGGYPFDAILQVASKEFGDPRLKLHILTVLKSMQSRRKTGASSYSDGADKRNGTSFSDEHIYIPVELFGIIAECEKKKNPGEGLLIKAKDLSWSILAMIASCFPDVSPLACLTVWLEITAARETSSIKVNDVASQIANNVAAAVESCNSLPAGARGVAFHYNRKNPKRRRLMESIPVSILSATEPETSSPALVEETYATQVIKSEEENKVEIAEYFKIDNEIGEGPGLLSKMVAVLCEQQLFLPLLRAFEMFLPSCSLLPFIRALQAFSQMCLSEASAHLGSFSVRVKEEPAHSLVTTGKEEYIASSWISSTAVKAADAVLSTCPSPYEKRCLLQLLAATDFGDGGYVAAYYRRLYWKINLAEPSLRKDNLHLGDETLDDASLLAALEKNGHWEQARNWARQLDASGGPWKSAVHHVTETQAESMVAEWREFLWDVPEERVSLWGHCQTLFIRYSFPPLQAGLFFLKQAEALEKELPAKELHELLLLSLQWLSGMITVSNPVYPLHLLREIETRVWLLAVESEAQMKSEGAFTFSGSSYDNIAGYSSGMIDRTASIITKMDNHITTVRNRTTENNDARDSSQTHIKIQGLESAPTSGAGTKTKRRAKGSALTRRPVPETVDRSTDSEDGLSNLNAKFDWQLHDDNLKIELSFSKWEERVGAEELERAVLSLLEFGQISAAKQLQHKLSPTHVPSEFLLVNAAVKLAAVSTPWSKVPLSILDDEVRAVIQSCDIPTDQHLLDPLEVLEILTATFAEGRGRGLIKRIIAVVKAANVLGLSFSEAFSKQPIEVLQLLSLKAQDSFDEAKLLVQTHPMPAASIARILAESFLKGLLAAHRGGYMDSPLEEGPAPLLWRFTDFLKWAELCPSEPEIGHALMRLVITGQEIPHTCEVELLILSHHFYKSSACLDGVDVLVALAANKVDSYVSEGDFACLARLITGVGNFHALNFILGILIENGQLNLLLQKYSTAAEADAATAEAVRGFRMAVLTTLKQFNPNDLDAVAMVYNHFDMKHEAAALLESRAEQSSQLWIHRYDKDQNEDLLESMRLYIEAAEVHTSLDAGNKTRRACAQAYLLSLQIRMPDFQWLNLSETNARRALVEQVRFLEALIVAEAYGLNQPSEWAPVLWNQMLHPELIEEFVAEFVAVLPLQPSMLIELAKFYRAEVAARGDQSQFSVWLTGGGLPAEWAKYLARSFRCLLKRTPDLRLRLQMAMTATGFGDVVDTCVKALDRVPENAGPLVLRRGHGGAYLPLM